MLKVKDLKKLLDYYEKNCPENMEDEVVVVISNNQDNVSIPYVSAKSADFGFDFNNGRFLIHTEIELMIKKAK